MYYNLTLSCDRITIVAMEKQQVLQHSESVFVVLGTQHANCMRSIVLSVACPALQNFTTLYRERRYFQKTLLNLKCVF